MQADDWRADPGVAAAWELAQVLLAESLPRRWRHSVGVFEAAGKIGSTVTDDRDLLCRAAVLHDIGYAPPLVKSGFHALDGATYLLSIGADRRLVSLVAHHSCASVEAEERGLAQELGAFVVERQDLVDALIYCDMTVSPEGQPVSVDVRIAEVRDRYGAASLVGRFIRRAEPDLRNASSRVEARLAQAGVGAAL
jgi:hypothetical protein